MDVKDGMSTKVLTVGPQHTLRAVATLMSERGVGAAVVVDPEANGLGILTERDVLRAVGAGKDTDTELVADHLTSDAVYASPGWSIDRAALTMVDGGFRHLIVVDGGDVVGVLSVRDIIRVWTQDGAQCELHPS
jgi:CBS domain-containing protein